MVPRVLVAEGWASPVDREDQWNHFSSRCMPPLNPFRFESAW
jgi:hypothetical protein